MMRKFSLLVTVLALAAAAALAQVPQQPPSGATPRQMPAQNQNPPAIVVRTARVIVPVTVKDSHGRLVGDLTKDEFRIFADGVEQQISQFSSEAVPLSAVVLIDNDLSGRVADQVQKSLIAISAGFGPNDEAAVVTFDQFPQTVSDFSFNNDLLYTKLKRLQLGSHNDQVIADPTTAGPLINGQPTPGSTGGSPYGTPSASSTGVPLHGAGRYKKHNALDDAVFAAVQMLKDRGRDRRKMIFIITDGNDAGRNDHTFDQTLHAILESDVVLYAISVNRSTPVGKSLLQHGISNLDKYADQTGGDTFFASKQNGLDRLYSDVTEQARNEYTLTFSPQDVHRGADYHEIEVRVKRPELTIETRRGYYESAIAAGH
ncbi:MAG TPA: VWA domain-containing protein [Candidatus Acidoferrales bacterium]|nr:VWA domain-containing protein [Candidatus Acidoferrales bacterium]